MPIQNEFIGMDLDSDSRKMKPGYTRENRNCRLLRSSGRNKEAVENMRGNTLLATVEDLPDGDNFCIGTCEDTKSETVFYFIYNSNSDHCIYRIFPALNYSQKIFQGSILNFSPDHTISHIDLVDDILTWTDGYNPPCKINVKKAPLKSSAVSKTFTTNLYFGDGYDSQWLNEVLDITIKAPGGATHSTTITMGTSFTTYKAGLVHVLAALSAWFPTILTCPMSANLINGKYISITQPSYSGPPWIFTITSAFLHPELFWYSDQNFYTQPYTRQQIDFLKWPHRFPMVPNMKKDSTVLFNKIRGHAFQFRARYIYDDNEKSTWGPISLPAIDSYLVGNDMLKTNKNYIELSYTDNSNLSSPIYRNMIKKVELAFREGNTGKWLSIVTLEQWQLVGKYKFYNDGSYAVIDDVSTSKLYDDVPQIAGSQEFGKQRMFFADYTEGYDEVPVDSKLDLTINDFTQPKTWKITGRAILKNLLNDSNQLLYRKDDYRIKPEPRSIGDWVFGANGFQGYGADYGQIGTLASNMHQNIPLGGFLFYLAGTDYIGITQQGSSGGTIVQDWVMDGVPPGEYILRVASHLCDYGGSHGSIYDLNSTSRAWQKTSTVVRQFCGSDSILDGFYELKITLGPSGGVFDTKGNIPAGCAAGPNAGNMYDNISGSVTIALPNNGDTYIGDMTWFKFRGGLDSNDKQGAVYGYLVEDDSHANTAAKMPGGIRMEGQIPDFDDNSTVTTGPKYSGFTDHNGFFYFCDKFYDDGGLGGISMRFNGPDVPSLGGNIVVKPVTQQFFIGSVYDPGAMSVANIDTVTPINSGHPFAPSNNSAVPCMAYCTNFSTVDKLRTTIIGKVFNSFNEPLSEIPVQFGRTGRSVVSDVNGIFKVIIYMLAQPGEWATGRFYDYLHVNFQLISRSNIGDFEAYTAGGYNAFTKFFYLDPNDEYSHENPTGVPEFPYILPAIDFAISALKRGGTYQFGRLYMDRGNRSTCVCTADDHKLYIPFFTEDLHKYLPVTYPTPGTFKYGQPSITWSIFNPAPAWATHYQWVRILDGYYSTYLQFVVASAEYVERRNPDGTLVTTSYGNSEATEVYMDLMGAITSFAGQNSGSLVGYSWTKGDRIRFIMDGHSNYFSTFIDMEIKGVYGNKIVIDYDNLMDQITQGTLVEVYTPNATSETQTDVPFFEISEVYPIVAGEHMGQSQNQSGATPAMGTFTHGDTYFRRRKMETFDTTNSNHAAFSNLYVEDASISDFYVSRVQDIGRINIINKDFKQTRYYADFRFGNVYVSGTNQNGMCEFDQLNHSPVPNKALGAIVSMVLINYVMLILQEHGENSAFINANVIVDATGSSIVEIVDKVINNVNVLKGGFGCQHPDTIMQDGGRVYYFSGYTGTLIRYSNDGCVPISDYGMISHFLTYGQLFTTSSNIMNLNFAAFIADKYNEYVLTATWKQYIDSEWVDKGFTVSFQEDNNSWTTFWDWMPEKFGTSGNLVYEFKDGIPWIQESNAVRNNFFGVQYTQQFRPVISVPAEEIKIYQSMWVQSNKKWRVPKILIPPDEMNLTGMESELLESDFVTSEGTHRAVFLCNKNTPSVTYPLLEGDVLRGTTMELQMENAETTEVVLHGINVIFNDSSLVKKK